MSRSICLVTITKLFTSFHAYISDNNTTFSVAKRGGTREYWGFKLYYGWNMLTHYIFQNIPINRLADTRKTEDKYIIFEEYRI